MVTGSDDRLVRAVRGWLSTTPGTPLGEAYRCLLAPSAEEARRLPPAVVAALGRCAGRRYEHGDRDIIASWAARR